MGQFYTKVSQTTGGHSNAAQNGCSYFKTFYLEYRVALGWGGEAEQRDKPQEFFKAQNDWLEEGSAKITAAVRIAVHLLSRDDAPPVFFDGEGGFEIPPLPEISQGADLPGQTRKILIYQEWPTQSKLLAHVRMLSFIHAYIHS